MAQEAELKINSSSVERTTVAVDSLIQSLEKLGKGAGQAEGASDQLTNSQKRKEAALASANIASSKAIALLKLEQKGLDKSSQEYAELRAAIIAKEVAAKKGIETSSKEFRSLKDNITAKEKATAETKRLAREQRKLSGTTKDASKDFGKFTGSLDRATKHVQLIDGPLGGVASRMTALSSIIKGGALGYAAFALSVGLGVKALWEGANVADKNQVAMKGLEAQLLATDHAAGFSANSLDHFARSLAFATLDNTEGVKELIGVMAGFDKVSGDAFTRSISLSQDLGIAMKQSPITAAKTLGKVLQNPIKNYLQLKRSGIEFSKVEKDNLKLAQRNNDLRAAQEIILGKVESKFKGIAKAQTDSLSGDKDTLGQNWQELWELLGTKVIPIFRAVTQAANFAVVAARELFETDAETEFRKWAIAGDHLKETSDQMATSMATLKEQLVAANAEQKKSGDILSDQLRSGNRHVQWAVDDALAKANVVEKIKLQIAAYKDLKVARDKSENKKQDSISEEAAKAIDKTELQLEQQVRLTKAFLETGDSRSLAYRQVKVAIDAESLATKINLNQKSDEFKVLKQNLQALSDLTEERVKHNAVVQKEKGLLSKQRGLEKQIALYALNKSGILSNSDAYREAAAKIDAKNSALQAGFDIGSKEHLLIESQTLALSELQKEAEKLGNLTAAGFKLDDIGRVLVEGSEAALRYANAELKSDIWDLFITGEIDRATLDERIEQVTETINDKLRQDLIPLGFTVDEVGNAVLLESMEGLALERQERLKELEDAWNENKINDAVIYAERYAEVQTEFDEKEVKRKEKLYEKTAKHKKLMAQAELTGTIASGLENLAAVKKSNGGLAKAAKAFSIFSASTSLVDSLSKAYALGYPLGIPAAAAAFAQGTQLIQMASGLNEPSFANGGVDIRGAGTGRSDSINAKIANGESVITATATNRHKETLRRMNAGLDVGGGRSGGNMSLTNSIVVQGDASEATIGLIQDKLLQFEDRVRTIADGASLESIQNEQEVGGLFDPI
ncbi:tail tape measure protein [Colwellia phage 9A]|uniref:Tail tape measure protein n=1 Tax=Colwellia phage 9A TaxID=765765 RepID=I3UMD9_9CAUD|nr:tail tape measure protein [Colwellia phage 9A]AFK66654.1 tail tape measure protein [Colwellia phage 9A]